MNKKGFTIYLLTSISTGYILLLISGLLIVEKNSNKIIEEKNTPFLIYEHENLKPKSISLHFMGKDFIFNF